MQENLKDHFPKWVRAFRASYPKGNELEAVTGVKTDEVDLWDRGEILPSEEALWRLCQYTRQSVEQMLAPFLPVEGANPNIRGRVCRQCAKSFRGGPRAWYCPNCRAERQRACARMAKVRKKRGLVRELGSIDRCERCGKEYTVTGGLQKYCPDCAPVAIAEKDRALGLEFYHKNKHHINPVRAQKRGELARERAVDSMWSLLSPGGIVYSTIDLKGWCIDNADLFDDHPERAYTGFAAIRASYKQGTFNRLTWHGWTLIEGGKPVTEWAAIKKQKSIWRLLSPDGKIYETLDLRNWCLSHTALLDGSPESAYSGFTGIRAGWKNKSFSASTWHGWTLMEDGKAVTVWAEELKPKPDHKWVLLAPDGTVHRARELRGWCLSHADLLDGVPITAWEAFKNIRYCYKNKSFMHQTWHGWTLIEDGKPVTKWVKLLKHK